MFVRDTWRVEKRKDSRTKVSWPVFAEIDRKIISGEAINISPGGVFILTQEPLKLRQVFELTIGVPFRECPVMSIVEAVRSQIVRSNVNSMPHGMGVKFIMLSDEDLESISLFVLDKFRSNIISFKRKSSRNLF